MTGRTGRRPGNPDTRGHILEVALRCFTRDGFEQTSIRGIAREAEVDPALVHRYFGDKRSVLLAAVRMSIDPRQLIESLVAQQVDDHTLAWQVADTWTRTWETGLGSDWFTMVREVPGLLPMMMTFLNETLVGAAERRLGLSPAQARLRAALVESQVVGFGLSRYITELDALARLSREDFVRLIAPFIHQALFSDLGVGPGSQPPRKSSPGPNVAEPDR